MSDANGTIKKISSLREKIIKDVGALSGLYASLKNEIDKRFRDELGKQKGDYSGLEDFYALVMLIKKDANTSSGVSNLLKRFNDLSRFNVSEIEDNIELEKIFE